jgi:hypothetical protein
MEGTDGQNVGCTIEDSLKSLIVYGAGPSAGSDDADAALHRRGQFFQIEAVGTDMFDAIRQALYLNSAEKRSVSVGTPWFLEWHYAPQGMLHDFLFRGDEPWHNWKICGWRTIAGQPYLIGKSWQGKLYGDGGYHYVSRTLCNKIFGISGTGAFTVRKATAADIQTIRLDIVSTILSYMRLWVHNLLTNEPQPRETPVEPVPEPAPDTPPTVPPTVPESEPAPVPPQASRVHICALAQQAFEGWWPGSVAYDHNNPGNIRDRHGVELHFSTYAAGLEALEDYIRRVASGAHPAYPKGGKTTIMEYTHIYTGDPEPSPTNYANAIAKALGVSTAAPMSYLVINTGSAANDNGAVSSVA